MLKRSFFMEIFKECPIDLDLRVLENRAKLEKMISNGEDYEKIVIQSQKLDVLINEKFKIINNI